MADNAGGNWEEFYETLFGYDTMRAMRTRLQQSKRPGLRSFRPPGDKLIDQWEQKIVESKRQRDEKILGKSEKAEMLANGISESEAAKRATAMAVSMVDAATETRQTMQDIAAGKLTDQAAMAKRQRIKQMLKRFFRNACRNPGIGERVPLWMEDIVCRHPHRSSTVCCTSVYVTAQSVETSRLSYGKKIRQI